MSHLQKRLAVFQYPAFCYFAASCALATVGTGLSYIAMTWMVLRDHNRISALAILMFCFWLPNVLLSPFVGVIIDRFRGRQHVIGLSNGLRGLVLLGFGYWLIHHERLIDLYLLALILGTAFSVYLPATFRLVREMVPEESLLYANATIDTIYEIGNIIGMGAAGILIAYFSCVGALLINGVLFVLSAILLLCIRARHLTQSGSGNEGTSFFQDFILGMRYLGSNRAIMIIYTVQLLLFVEFLTAPVLLAPFAKNVLHASVGQFGQLEASLSLGAVIGGFFLPWLADKFGALRVMIIGIMVLGAGFILFSETRILHVAQCIYFCIGFALAIWPIALTTAQNLTDIHYQARVQSCFSSLSGLCILIIYLVVKYASQYVSIRHLFWMQAAFSLLAIVLIWLFQSGKRHSED